ncbi:MAG TPA: carboxypeptidase-like regulatory domain-containing protein [Ferruginibacter sp.]|nr:carboxypeptidase-like regulatory domain-containing protein [Ferruginibacter sp.]
MAANQYYNKQWGVEDFERYHSGKMPDAEKHALEKAALDDPFLDDALEGYAFTKTPVADIEALKKQLQPKEESSKIIWYKQKSIAGFLRVAAILILFAGLAWLLFPNKTEKPVEIASVTERVKTIEPIASEPVPDTTVSSPSAADEKKAKPEPESSKTMESYDVKSTLAKGQESIAAAPNSNDEDFARTKDLAAKASELETADKNKARAKTLNGKVPGLNVTAVNVIKGRVVDAEGQPVPFANIQVPSNRTNFAADANGNFSFANSQNATTVKVDVNAVGFETANTALNSKSNDNKIVLQENNQALSEVVVVGYGNTKKQVVTGAATQTKKEAFLNNGNNIITFKNAIPQDGWENFNQVINEFAKNKKSFDTTGTVILSFDIDSLGAATNISIKKSLSDSSDAYAKRMLEMAPALKKIKKSKKLEAILQF